MNAHTRFRKALKPNVFHGVDLGSGSGSAIARRINKNNSRRFAAVDREFAPTQQHHAAGQQLQRKGVVIGYDNLDFLKRMQKENLRTYSLTAILPEVDAQGIRMMNEAMKRVPHVLMPTGKMQIVSVDKEFLGIVGKFAQREGLRWRWKKEMAASRAKTQSDWAESFVSHPLYRIEISLATNKPTNRTHKK